MESDLSSSDAALRMLFVEDVELLESGIFRSLFSVRCQGDAEVTESWWRSVDLCGCAVRRELFFFPPGQVQSFYGVICLQLSDVKHTQRRSNQSMRGTFQTHPQTLYTDVGEYIPLMKMDFRSED